MLNVTKLSILLALPTLLFVFDAQAQNSTPQFGKHQSEDQQLDQQMQKLDQEIQQLDQQKQKLDQPNGSGDISAICKATECAAVSPQVVVGATILSVVVGELNKSQPFGPTNTLMQVFHAVGDGGQAVGDGVNHANNEVHHFINCLVGCH